MRLAVIDGDSIIYAIGWTKKDLDPDDFMSIMVATDEIMDKIIKATNASHVLGFLGGVQPTFRTFSSHLGDPFEVEMKGYKESRSGYLKPVWYYQSAYLITHRLRTKYGFSHIEWIEADDAVLICANHYQKKGEDVVICSPDKDLKQFPGIHYDYSKDATVSISEQEANFNFWKQMIMGDSTDDIEGIPGLGEKKTQNFLNGLKPEHYRDSVLTLYQAKFGERKGILRFAMTYNYLHILRDPSYKFDPENPELAPKPITRDMDGGGPDKLSVDDVFK